MTTNRTVSFDVDVSYRQIYLADLADDMWAPETFLDDHPEHPVGIIRVKDGKGLLVTGLHTGTVGFSVTVSDRDPEPDVNEYEDIVEISFHTQSGRIFLIEWGGEGFHKLPDLSSGPGWYRLRYHAVHMDRATEADCSTDAVIDRYLLQIWPQNESIPQVVKSTSRTLTYWRNAK
ncbi:hypothetical protein [Microbispora sp. CA-102843]|uniref:hypothetical protein n=1 Tax=Microbispora sp. CA-102843 TaxID=3239952 RepID=UPI003D8DE27C